MSPHDFFDLGRLFRFREALARIEAADAPEAVLLDGAGRIESGRIGILPGSFNPPTVAHLQLAAEARRRFRLDRVVFSLSSVIVDKERLEGLCREDRLLLLSLMGQERPWSAVAVTNRGLYSEQAPAFQARFGSGVELWFVVGMDKVLQIFDPKYYRDRDRALDALFAHARLIGANREDRGGEDLAALLARPENLPYRDRVRPLVLPAHLKDQSSSAVRRGVAGASSWEESLPEVARDFVAATGAFRDRYGLRAAAIDVLYPLRQWAETEVALERLLARGAEPGAAGEAVREVLSRPMTPESLMDRLRSLGLTRSGS